MVKSRKFLSLVLFITLLLTAFVSLMITSGLWGGNAKLDMTDNRRYSLSSASEKYCQIKIAHTNQGISV